MALRYVIPLFGLLAAAIHAVWLKLHHVGGFHTLMYPLEIDVPHRWLTVGLYVAAGFVGAQRRFYSGVVASMGVAVVGRSLGWILAALFVPGGLEVLRAWPLSFLDRQPFLSDFILAAVCGAVGTALSRLPLVNTRDRANAA